MARLRHRAQGLQRRRLDAHPFATLVSRPSLRWEDYHLTAVHPVAVAKPDGALSELAAGFHSHCDQLPGQADAGDHFACNYMRRSLVPVGERPCGTPAVPAMILREIHDRAVLRGRAFYPKLRYRRSARRVARLASREQFGGTYPGAARLAQGRRYRSTRHGRQPWLGDFRRDQPRCDCDADDECWIALSVTAKS